MKSIETQAHEYAQKWMNDKLGDNPTPEQERNLRFMATEIEIAFHKGIIAACNKMKK